MIELQINDSYKVYEIREIEAPFLNIWPLQTMSFPCSQDGKGRARLLLVDITEQNVLGLYHGFKGDKYIIVTGLDQTSVETLCDIVKWDLYKN